MSSKGISEFVSHILAIAIAFVILGIIASTMYNYYTSLVLESQSSEARSVSERIGDRVMEMYSKYDVKDVEPEPGKNLTLASATVDVPDGIAGRNYNIYLNSSKAHWINAELHSTANISVIDTRRPTARILVEVTEFPERTYTYRLYNIEINATGKVRRPDKINLKYVRENKGGNITDRVIMDRYS